MLSLGSWNTYDRMHYEDGVEMLREAVAAGISLFDVGVYPVNVGYGEPDVPHHSDVLFGRMMEKAGIAREDYVLAEKLWLGRWPEMSFARQLDRGLFRIGADYADVGLLGDIRRPGFDFERIVAEIGELLEAGRLRCWGINNWSVAEIEHVQLIAKRQGVPGPQLCQLKYNITRRTLPDGQPYRALFERWGMSLQASSVFEGGLLAMACEPPPTRHRGFDPGGVRPVIEALKPRLVALAREFDATPGQLSIAFCLGHPQLASVLFGSTSLGQLRENLGAVELFERHGPEIRERSDELWADRDLLDPHGEPDRPAEPLPASQD